MTSLIGSSYKEGKTYLRELYSDPAKNKELQEKIKKYFASWNSFDSFRQQSNSCPQISYSVFTHTAGISTTDQPSGNWDLYEADHFSHRLEEFAKDVFPHSAEKADAVFNYLFVHRGSKKCKYSLSQFAHSQDPLKAKASFIPVKNKCIQMREDIRRFFHKIQDGKFKTVEQKEEEESPKFKINEKKKEIDRLKNELAKRIFVDPSPEILNVIDNFNSLKTSHFSVDGQKLANELLDCLKDLKERCQGGKLKHFDLSRLQNPKFVNILSDSLYGNLRNIIKSLNTWFSAKKINRELKLEIKDKKLELKQIQDLEGADSENESSSTSESELTDDSSSSEETSDRSKPNKGSDLLKKPVHSISSSKKNSSKKPKKSIDADLSVPKKSKPVDPKSSSKKHIHLSTSLFSASKESSKHSNLSQSNKLSSASLTGSSKRGSAFRRFCHSIFRYLKAFWKKLY